MSKKVIKVEDGPMVLDPRSLRSGDKEIRKYFLQLDEKALSVVPSVRSVEAPEVTCEFRPLDDCIVCRMKVSCHPVIVDDRTGEETRIECSDTEDLTLSHDEERADILPDERGRYDLEPTALALFFACIPEQEGDGDFEPIEGDGYEVISEDEFERRKASGYYSDNPFSSLKDDG